MAVFVTGDIHAQPERLSVEGFVEQKELTKDDIVIILGDFGLVWDYEAESRYERYWLDWLNNKSFTTVFIDGNHENYDRLDAYPISEWKGGRVQRIRDSVIHLMRGEVYDIEGYKFFVFGGAASHDITDGILEKDDPRIKKWQKDRFKLFRVNHVSWWERELPSDEEMDNGIKKLAANNNKVDYILTHCPYTSLLKVMDGGSELYVPDRLTDYLEDIRQTVEFRHWLFGHMHINKTYQAENSSCLYEQIIRIL